MNKETQKCEQVEKLTVEVSSKLEGIVADDSCGPLADDFNCVSSTTGGNELGPVASQRSEGKQSGVIAGEENPCDAAAQQGEVVQAGSVENPLSAQNPLVEESVKILTEAVVKVQIDATEPAECASAPLQPPDCAPIQAPEREQVTLEPSERAPSPIQPPESAPAPLQPPEPAPAPFQPPEHAVAPLKAPERVPASRRSDELKRRKDSLIKAIYKYDSFAWKPKKK